jgi:hypothetical protein
LRFEASVRVIAKLRAGFISDPEKKRESHKALSIRRSEYISG